MQKNNVDWNIAPTAAADKLLFVPHTNHKDIKYVVLANNCFHTPFTCSKSNVDDLTTDNYGYSGHYVFSS